ncbi:MAG: methyl-accepting chemotaxis protein, partial [Candidatus Heimdallarchaeota archaeon]
KRSELKLWFLSCLTTTIGYIINAFPQEAGNQVNPVAMILFSSGTFILLYAVFKEYYRTFIKVKKMKSANIKYTAAALTGGVTFGFYFMMLGLIITCFVLVIRLYIKKRSLLHAFYCLNFVGGIMSLLGAMVSSSGTGPGQDFNNFAMTYMDTIYLVMGLVAIIEYRIHRVNDSLKNIIDTASQTSVNVSNIATELAAGVSEVNAASEEISSSTQEASATTIEVMDLSNKIRNIMNIITSISDQTNLLALNASIEAGRAGAHGRGFAVVASEVRKLAENSKKAISNTDIEINEIIYKIQTVSSAMEGISASAEQQTASMEEIAATASKLDRLAEDLKTSLTQNQ